MGDLTFRILGYNHDFGVVRIEGRGKPQDIVIFPSQSLEGHIRLNAQYALFISKKGEFAKLDLTAAKVVQRAKPLRYFSGRHKLFITPNQQSLVIVTDDKIQTFDLKNLKLNQTIDTVAKNDSGVFKLHSYSDFEQEFEAAAEAERTIILEWRKANDGATWFGDKKWIRTRQRYWPVSREKFRALNFIAQHASQKHDGQLILPYTKGRNGPLGIARVDLDTATISYEDFVGNYIDLKAISDDGTGLLISRHRIVLKNSALVKKKRLFGFKRSRTNPELEYSLEVWNLGKSKSNFESYLALFSGPSNLEPQPPSKEEYKDRTFLYDSYYRDYEIDKCRLDAAKFQFETLFETLNWSKDKYKADFCAALKRRKVKIDPSLERELKNEHHLQLRTRQFMVQNFLHFALSKSPNFLKDWQNKPLTDAQNDQLKSLIRRPKEFPTALAFSWSSVNADIYVITDAPKIMRLAKDKDVPESFAMEIKTHHLGNLGVHLTQPRPDTLLFESFNDAIQFELPLQPSDTSDMRYARSIRIYDRDSRAKEHERSERLARKARRGYVTIRSTSADNLIEGLCKLTAEYAEAHEEIVLSNRWDAGLVHRKSLILEKKVARLLTAAQDPSAIDALEAFVQTIMKISAKNDQPISPYPRDFKHGHVDWSVWHSDDGTQVGMPSVNALISLSQSVPDTALTFYRYRDFEHDGYTGEEGLTEDVLAHVSIDQPGMLKLIAIVAFQLLATGNVENDLFAQHGMDKVAAALKSKSLDSKLAAKIFVEEAKGLEGSLSWGNKNGPAGLVAQAVYGLDQSVAWKVDFGEDMLNIYPEAKTFLEEVKAG